MHGGDKGNVAVNEGTESEEPVPLTIEQAQKKMHELAKLPLAPKSARKGQDKENDFNGRLWV